MNPHGFFLTLSTALTEKGSVSPLLKDGFWKNGSSDDWRSVGYSLYCDAEQAWMIIGGGAPSMPSIGTM